MKILFIGYSNLLRRRILPIIDNLNFEEVHIAKYKGDLFDVSLGISTPYKVYDSYEDAFEQSDAEVCYVTSVNSNHFESGMKALSQRRHTIIDKPLCLDILDFLALKNMALMNDVLLAESTVYTYHPKFNNIDSALKRHSKTVKHISAVFSVPPFESGNFRYKKELGGGAINDMGPYAVSLGRYFFGEEPYRVYTNINDIGSNVEKSFDVLLVYSEGRSVIGHFGFTTPYVNKIELLGPGLHMQVSPVFSSSEKELQAIEFTVDGTHYLETVEPASTFELFFMDVLSSTDFKKFVVSAEMDCKTLHQMRHIK